MTQITENDVMLNNEKNDFPLPKEMTWIPENDVIEKNDVPLPKKWQESQIMKLCSITKNNDLSSWPWSR